MNQEVTNDDVIIQDLVDNVTDLVFVVDQIKRLHDDGLFKYLSKASRNSLMQGLLDKAGAVDEITKVAFRSLKKIKRERVPEEVVDLLIAGDRNRAVAFRPTVTGNPPISDGQ
jgi:hypothetical protein